MTFLKCISKSLVRRLAHQFGSPTALRRIGEPLLWAAGCRAVRRPPWRAPRRILVLKLDRLGDLVICSPFLHSLRRVFPNAKIVLAVRESLAQLASQCPDVDSVAPVPLSEDCMMMQTDGNYERWTLQTIRWLRFCCNSGWWSQHFDWAVIPRRDVDYYGASALAYVSGASRRVAVTSNVTETKARLNRGFDVLFTDPVSDFAQRHEVFTAQPLLEAMGASFQEQPLKAWVSNETRRQAWKVLRSKGIAYDERLVAVCMGASAANRQWPVERYEQVCAWLTKAFHCRIITLGSKNECDLGRTLRARLGARVINLEGDVSLAILPAIMEHTCLYLGSDTGPMHVAAAAQNAVVMICCHPESGSPTADRSPFRFGPWGVRSRVVQPKIPTRPCRDSCVEHSPHCILAISVAVVVKALRGFLPEIEHNKPALANGPDWTLT